MKKQILVIAFLVSGVASAQVWSENFNLATVPLLPSAWFQNNIDGLTPNASISSYNFGTNAGVTRNVSTSFGLHPSYGGALLTTSKYTSPGTSNDWVISPNFNVPANSVFNWDVTSLDPIATGIYEVRISTTGTTVANFTANPPLFAIAGEIYNPGNAITVGFTQRGVSLDAYAGQNVHLAIHDIGNDRWQTAYDNFAVTVPANQHDGSILSVNGLTRYMVGAYNQNISGTFKQFGYGTATTAVINCLVNNGTPITQTFTFGTPVPYYGSSNFTFTNPVNLGLGINKIKVWVSAINGISEVNMVNDTAFQYVYVASQYTNRHALIEGFCSSTCPPCASVHNNFDPLLIANNANSAGGDVNVINYQMNWPSPQNDPSYNPDGFIRRAYYNCNSIPYDIANGNIAMTSRNQTEINSAKVVPAFVAITAYMNFIGNNFVGSANITPYVSIPTASPLKVFQVLAQKSYSYNGASTTQKMYYHVMRKMFPDGNGVVLIPTDGVLQTVSFSHIPSFGNLFSGTPAQDTYNFWTSTVVIEYEYIVFVQDMVSKEILNSASSQFGPFATGLVNLKNDEKIGVYPNPAKDDIVVGIKLKNESKVTLTIFDINGRVVYSNKDACIDQGQNEIKINTSEFTSGSYNIIVNTNEGVLTEKMIISK